MAEPRDMAERIEAEPALPAGEDERFVGYGVMALPFASEHILCSRRFPATSVGPGYYSVWHRDPEGRWTFWQDAEPLRACPRYWGGEIDDARPAQIATTWTGPRSFELTMRGERDELRWHVDLSPTPVTRAMSAFGAMLPDALWRQPAVLTAMGAVARATLRTGNLRLAGRAPNGQDFIVNPRYIWSIASSSAVLNGEDLGPVGPVSQQAQLGDFWIPNRGLFATGRAFFDTFDEAKHQAAPTRAR